VWSGEYLRKYYAVCIVEWERSLKANHWDEQARAKLSYFAKHKWRRLFLYEHKTAIKIQVRQLHSLLRSLPCAATDTR
jgi:hypothetical protein